MAKARSTKKKPFYQARPKVHSTPHAWSGAAALTSKDADEIERSTPTLQALYEFLETPLPWGEKMPMLRGRRR